MNPATTDAVVRGLLGLRRGAGKQNKGGAAMVSRLSRLRVLSVLLTFVLVAPPLGGCAAGPAKVGFVRPAGNLQPVTIWGTMNR